MERLSNNQVCALLFASFQPPILARELLNRLEQLPHHHILLPSFCLPDRDPPFLRLFLHQQPGPSVLFRLAHNTASIHLSFDEHGAIPTDP